MFHIPQKKEVSKHKLPESALSTFHMLSLGTLLGISQGQNYTNYSLPGSTEFLYIKTSGEAYMNDSITSSVKRIVSYRMIFYIYSQWPWYETLTKHLVICFFTIGPNINSTNRIYFLFIYFPFYLLLKW